MQILSGNGNGKEANTTAPLLSASLTTFDHMMSYSSCAKNETYFRTQGQKRHEESTGETNLSANQTTS
jgi:hypothetical protein